MLCEFGNWVPPVNGEQWWYPQFLRPEQWFTHEECAHQLNTAQSTTIAEQYGSSPFANTVGCITQQNPDYAGALEASQHQAAPSDTISVGHTSPESSTSPPASRPVTCITDLDSEMESSVDSVPPASSTLSMPAPANEDHSSLDQPSTMSSLMSLTFVCLDKLITHIDNELPYDDPYAQPFLTAMIPQWKTNHLPKHFL